MIQTLQICIAKLLVVFFDFLVKFIKSGDFLITHQSAFIIGINHGYILIYSYKCFWNIDFQLSNRKTISSQCLIKTVTWFNRISTILVFILFFELDLFQCPFPYTFLSFSVFTFMRKFFFFFLRCSSDFL